MCSFHPTVWMWTSFMMPRGEKLVAVDKPSRCGNEKGLDLGFSRMGEAVRRSRSRAVCVVMWISVATKKLH